MFGTSGSGFANKLAFLWSIDVLPRVFDYKWLLGVISLTVCLPASCRSAGYARCMSSQRFGDDQSLFFAVSINLDESLTVYLHQVRVDAHPSTTPPPSGPNFASAFKNTSNSFNSGGFQNISEPVEMVRNVLRWELKSNLELDHPDFIATYLAEIPQVDDAATAVFKKCCDGKDPFYTTGYRWRGWEDGDEKGVQRSLEGCISKFMKFLEEASIEPPSQRRFVPSPNTPVPGAVKRKPDLCVATFAGESIGVLAKPNKQIASWRQVLVAIELKSSGQDGLEKTWLDVMKYAREIFRHQDSRRFVLGLTLCGSTMRLWEFDRLGATTSVAFDIHKNGPFFVKTLLSFLWMNDGQLGIDPDLMEVDGQRFVKINRDDKEERLIITETLRAHTACIAGRATTCWKAYREGDDSKKPLVVKDSWCWIPTYGARHYYGHV